MKKLILFAALITMISCKKDEIVYTQEQLNGTWEATEINSLGCIQQLKISSTSLTEVKICEGIRVEFEAEEYSFDGRILRYKLYGIHFEFEISELTEQILMLGYHDPVEYNRVAE